MENKNFENYLQEQLSQYPDVDAEKSWEDFEKILNKEEKRRPIFLLFLFVGILLTSIVSISLLKQKKHPTNKVNKTESINSKSNKKEEKKEEHNHLNLDRNSISKILSKENHNGYSSTSIFESEKSLEKQFDLGLSQNTTTKSISSKKESEAEIINSSETKISRKSIIPNFVNTPWLTNLSIHYSREIPEVNHTFTNNDPPQKKPSRKNWLFRIEGGLHKQKGSIDPLHNDYEELVLFRNSTESFDYGMQLSTKLSYMLSDSWYTGIGLGFKRSWLTSQIMDTLHDQVLQEDALIKVIINPITGVVLDSVYGDTLVNRSIHRHIIRHSSFDMLNIPIHVGYLLQRNKWTLGVETGLNIGVWISRKGYIINPDLSSTEIDNGILNRKTLSFGYVLNATIGYSLSENFSISLTPQINKSVTNWYSPLSGSRLKPMDLELNLGSIYKF